MTNHWQIILNELNSMGKFISLYFATHTGSILASVKNRTINLDPFVSKGIITLHNISKSRERLGLANPDINEIIFRRLILWARSIGVSADCNYLVLVPYFPLSRETKELYETLSDWAAMNTEVSFHRYVSI